MQVARQASLLLRWRKHVGLPARMTAPLRTLRVWMCVSLVHRFPPQYPFKPPSISLFTPNGRFQTNAKLCLSMTDFHPESWCGGVVLCVLNTCVPEHETIELHACMHAYTAVAHISCCVSQGRIALCMCAQPGERLMKGVTHAPVPLLGQTRLSAPALPLVQEPHVERRHHPDRPAVLHVSANAAWLPRRGAGACPCARLSLGDAGAFHPCAWVTLVQHQWAMHLIKSRPAYIFCRVASSSMLVGAALCVQRQWPMCMGVVGRGAPVALRCAAAGGAAGAAGVKVAETE